MINRLHAVLPDDDFLKANCPNIHNLGHITSLCVNTPSIIKTLSTELSDTTDIDEFYLNTTKKIIGASATAGFKDLKGTILIVCEITDLSTGQIVSSDAVTTQSSNTLNCSVFNELENDEQNTGGAYKNKTVFYWTETSANGQAVMHSKEIITQDINKFTLDKIIENITIDSPKCIYETNDRIKILYGRDTSHVETPDIIYADAERASDGTLPYVFNFKGSLRMIDSYKIESISRDKFVMKLTEITKKRSVYFDNDSQWDNATISISDDGRTLNWSFDRDWGNKINVADIDIRADFDFYAVLPLIVSIGGLVLDEPINVIVTSSSTTSGIVENIKGIFIQWGCLAGSTQIKMADNSFKQISEVEIGEIVATQNGTAKVINSYNGDEKEVVCLSVDGCGDLLMTDGHPVLTSRGWLRCKDLNAGDKIITESGEAAIINGLYIRPFNDKVYNLELDGDNHSLIAEGVIVGDFNQQNNIESSFSQKEVDESLAAHTVYAEEFRALAKEINRRNGK